MTSETWFMAVCPHDTAGRPEAWFFFTQELSRLLGRSLRLHLVLDVAEFEQAFSTVDLLYANPPHTLLLTRQLGFSPLARFESCFDEAVLVCRRETGFTLKEVTGRSIATANIPLVTRLITDVLHREGITPGLVTERKSWGDALKNLLRGGVDFAILYRDFYQDLQQSIKEQLTVLYESHEQRLFHCFLLAPRHQTVAGQVQEALLKLPETEAGAQALSELRKHPLVAVNQRDLDAFDA